LESETCKLGIYPAYNRARKQHPTPIFPIGHDVEVGPKISNLLPNPSTPKCLWLHKLPLLPPHVPQVQYFIQSSYVAKLLTKLVPILINKSAPAVY
jgi:hypothetical protein